MTLGNDFQNICPLFDHEGQGGVVWPIVVTALGGAAPYLDFDATSGSIHSLLKLPMKAKCISADVLAVADGQGAKAATASTEAIIGFVYGVSGITTVASGTSFGVATCEATLAANTRITATITATDIAKGSEIITYLKQAAASATSANQDGAAKVVLWFALSNAP